MNQYRYRKISSLALLLVGLATAASGATLGLTFNAQDTNDGNFTLGFKFTVSQTINVVSLGVWDKDSNGLQSSHQVGLWNTSGTLLTSTTVASGTTDALQSGFRFHDLTSAYTLAPGTYIVGAQMFNGGDRYGDASNLANIFTASGITYVNGVFKSGTSFGFPNLTDTQNDFGWFGANFRFDTAPGGAPGVPDGGSGLIMFGLVLVGLAIAARRRILG